MGLEGDSSRSRPPFRVHNFASIDGMSDHAFEDYAEAD